MKKRDNFPIIYLTMFIRAVILVCFSGAFAHDYYRDRIPNGYSVPDPCSGGIWQAVGHFSPLHHTHDKNPFALNFAAAGHKWTADLCGMDSDGDGVTNGAELGDPGCTWTQGSSPSGVATGQPGICEPVGSAACSGQAYICGCHGHHCTGK